MILALLSAVSWSSLGYEPLPDFLRIELNVSGGCGMDREVTD